MSTALTQISIMELLKRKPSKNSRRNSGPPLKKREMDVLITLTSIIGLISKKSKSSQCGNPLNLNQKMNRSRTKLIIRNKFTQSYQSQFQKALEKNLLRATQHIIEAPIFKELET